MFLCIFFHPPDDWWEQNHLQNQLNSIDLFPMASAQHLVFVAFSVFTFREPQTRVGEFFPAMLGFPLRCFFHPPDDWWKQGHLQDQWNSNVLLQIASAQPLVFVGIGVLQHRVPTDLSRRGLSGHVWFSFAVFFTRQTIDGNKTVSRTD